MGVLGSIVSGLFGASEQRRSQDKNLNHQIRLAKNAHKFEVDDMRRAGLNPILSATGGSGAKASGGSGIVQPPKFANTAISIRRANQEIKNMQAQERLLNAQTNSTNITAQGNEYLNTGKSLISSGLSPFSNLSPEQLLGGAASAYGLSRFKSVVPFFSKIMKKRKNSPPPSSPKKSSQKRRGTYKARQNYMSPAVRRALRDVQRKNFGRSF